MKLTRLKALTLTLLFTLASSFNAANAALITYNGYTLDTDTDIVTGGGLEWLQWDVTIGESINSALAANGIFGGNYYRAGWTLATNAHMAALFDAFSFNSTTDENQYKQTNLPYEAGTDETNMDFFISLFGTTVLVEGNYYGTGVDALRYSWALYGADSNNNNIYNDAIVISDLLTYDEGCTPCYSDTLAALNDEFIWQASSSYTNFGVALVRSTPVPEPSTVAILALGLFGLGLRRSVRV
jgi:hypothetical protein